LYILPLVLNSSPEGQTYEDIFISNVVRDIIYYKNDNHTNEISFVMEVNSSLYGPFRFNEDSKNFVKHINANGRWICDEINNVINKHGWKYERTPINDYDPSIIRKSVRCITYCIKRIK
jgi:hypothetical protein